MVAASLSRSLSALVQSARAFPTSYILRSADFAIPNMVGGGSIFFPDLECAPDGGQIAGRELTEATGLSEDESHGQPPHLQRRVQTADRPGLHGRRDASYEGLSADHTFERRDLCLVVLKQISRPGIIVERSGFKLPHPHRDRCGLRLYGCHPRCLVAPGGWICAPE